MKSPKARAPSFAALSLVMTLLACQLEVPVRPSFTAISQPAPNTNHSMPGLQQAGLALSENDEAKRARASKVYSRMPIGFEVNCGQTDSQVKFLSRGAGYTLFLASTEAVMMLRSPESKVISPMSGVSQNESSLTTKHPSITPDNKPPANATLRMKLTNSNPAPVMEGIDPLPGKSNYITGGDPGKWQTNVSQYAGVKYADIYAGIDLIYHGDQGGLEYDFVLSPGADPKTVNLSFDGAQRMRIDSDGDLVLKTEPGEIRQRRPVAYQEIEGERKAVECRFALKDHSEVDFELGKYDANRRLVIDPVLSYSTYLGGSGFDDCFLLEVDASGNAYVAGRTESSDFPTTAGAFQRGSGGGSDGFVTKLDERGAVLYSTYLGGSGFDDCFCLKVDTSDNVYVSGDTESPDFPTTAGAFQPNFGGVADSFVTKLDANGNVLYSTYLGGSGDDESFSLGLDASANVYVFGDTDSPNFPTTAGAFQPKFGGVGDSFVTKLDASGKVLYSTYLGGSDFDESDLFSLGVDASGNVYVSGDTNSPDFPTTAGAFQRNYGGQSDVFVTKLDANGKLLYSTYLGGRFDDSPDCLGLDALGNVHVTGQTYSSDFPTTAGAFQRKYGGSSEVFVAKLDANGKVVYSTYLGGSDFDVSSGLELDTSGNVYVNGHTSSSDFPTTEGAFQRNFGGEFDVFVTRLDASGAVLYSTYIGGSGADLSILLRLKLDASGNVYVAGRTDSSDFPTRFPVQPVNGGIFFEDAFAMAFNAAGSLLYSTYLGGSGSDVPIDVAVDSSGNFYLAGRTGSPDFPITSGAFQSKKKGHDFSGFITKIEPLRETGILRILNASVIRDTLYVVGESFDQKATVTLDGEKQKTRRKERDQTVLISKAAGKKIKRGQTVAIRVRNSDGRLSDVFNFTRLR